MRSVSFQVVEGYHWQQWRQSGIFREPGGDGQISGWETEAPGLFTARLKNGGTPSPAPFRGRWQKAQHAEARFWRGWRQNVLYHQVSLVHFWADILEKTGGPLEPGKVLDVGCGPVSVLNFFRGEGVLPMGLDPLAATYAADGLVETRRDWEPIPMIALPAEKLPFADESLDHLICFNVLDHVADAPAVLAELRRILKPGGSLRVYVHTFAPWIKRFLFFDRPHTYHWDHREFARLLAVSGFSLTREHHEPKSFDLPSGWWGKFRFFPYWVATKVGATSYFQVRKP